QSVEEDILPRYWRLISEFDKLTGVPLLLNTSFNENEPIVMTPAEAVDTFSKTKMDLLVLGNRSIVTDPRRDDMKDILNARIKHREPFRPFAPSILAERVGEWFEQDYPSPFMVLVYKTAPDKRERLGAVNHVDDTGRVQSVEERVEPRYHRLISEFERLTGVPVLLNTSFNENEPIVMTPADAVDTFQKTKMDVLALGNFVARRAAS
ncbi:MAG: carbamoyltransferase, partial [Gaiellaceae bacterium]|nr:carbamoyltransferase [Gaiellaceae bacterium]